MMLKRRALLGGVGALAATPVLAEPCGEEERRKLLKFGDLLIPEAQACGGGGGGPGPSSSSAFVAADFTNLTGKTVAPQLFGISTGGLANPGNIGLSISNTPGNWADFATFPNLRTRIRALNVPIVRVNGLWQNSRDTFNGPSMLDNLLNNIASAFPTTTTWVYAISCGTLTFQAFHDFSQAFCQYWKDHAPTGYKLSYLECLNENDELARSTYNSCFSGMVAGAQAVDATIKGAGCTDRFQDSSNLTSLIASQSASTLGLLDWHGYQFLGGVDPAPSDFQVMTSAAAPNAIGDTFNSGNLGAIEGSTYAAGLPGFLGEWNVDGSGNAGTDARIQTNIGTGFMISTLLKGAAGSAAPAWGGVWDPYEDGVYDLISADGNTFAPASGQYYALQNLVRAMPGSMVSTTTGNGNVLAWATKTGTNLGLAIVNANNSSQSGQIALSHWPVNGSGTGTAKLWRLDASNYLSGGTTISNLSVTSGLTSSVTLSPMSVAILSVP